MPLFAVTEYFTYADRFEVLAATPEEARAQVQDWYAALRGPQPEPSFLFDPDVMPVVIQTEKNVFVDGDGFLVCNEDGEIVYDG